MCDRLAMSSFCNFTIFILLLSITLIKECNASDAYNEGTIDYVMDKSITDLFNISNEGEARSILFDRFGAFNTSLAFFIPLFSWYLPGSADVAAAGFDGKQYGLLALAIFIMVGGLGIAIHTITNGGISSLLTSDVPAAESRRLGHNDRFLNLVYDSIERSPDYFDIQSCAEFLICEAHAESEKYGIWTLPVKYLIPAYVGAEEQNLTEFEKAAIYGKEKKDDCHYEYPCLIQSLINLLFYSRMLTMNIIEQY